MTPRSITMKGKNSYRDFGWYVTAIQLTPPRKRKVLVTVPHRSGSYDFSEILGSPVYEDRELTITFRKEIPRESALYADQAADFVAWLYAPYGDEPRCDIVDSRVSGWVYRGECTEVTTTENNLTTEIEARFVADPFRHGGRQAMELMTDSGGAVYVEFANDNVGAVPVDVGWYMGSGEVWIKSTDTETGALWDGAADVSMSSGYGVVMVPPGTWYIALKYYYPHEDGVTLSWRDMKV